jgi:hypothetical protein
LQQMLIFRFNGRLYFQQGADTECRANPRNDELFLFYKNLSKFFLSIPIIFRDLRQRVGSLYGFHHEFLDQFARGITCPHLLIKVIKKHALKCGCSLHVASCAPIYL